MARKPIALPSRCFHRVQSTAYLTLRKVFEKIFIFFQNLIYNRRFFSLATFRLIYFPSLLVITRTSIAPHLTPFLAKRGMVFIVFFIFFFTSITFKNHILPLVVRLCCHSEEFQVYQRRFNDPIHFRVLVLDYNLFVQNH